MGLAAVVVTLPSDVIFCMFWALIAINRDKNTIANMLPISKDFKV